jgi:hypothetical protein
LGNGILEARKSRKKMDAHGEMVLIVRGFCQCPELLALPGYSLFSIGIWVSENLGNGFCGVPQIGLSSPGPVPKLQVFIAKGNFPNRRLKTEPFPMAASPGAHGMGQGWTWPKAGFGVLERWLLDGQGSASRDRNSEISEGFHGRWKPSIWPDFLSPVMSKI